MKIKYLHVPMTDKEFKKLKKKKGKKTWKEFILDMNEGKK